MKKKYWVCALFNTSLLFNCKNQNIALHKQFFQLKDNTFCISLGFVPVHLQLQRCFQNYYSNTTQVRQKALALLSS